MIGCEVPLHRWMRTSFLDNGHRGAFSPLFFGRRCNDAMIPDAACPAAAAHCTYCTGVRCEMCYGWSTLHTYIPRYIREGEHEDGRVAGP